MYWQGDDTFSQYPPMIPALLDTTKVINSIEIGGDLYEVCAEAIANHNRGSNLLTVHLNAFLRATRHDHLGERVVPGWLPAPQVVTEHVEFDEAHEITGEIFATWCRKVEGAVTLLPRVPK